MKAGELRKGNIVKRGNDVINGLTTLEIHKFDLGQISLEPIPLTEEWLERFGFDRSELKGRRCYTILYDDRCVLFLYEANGFFYIEQGGIGSNSFKHVHSLQNLYFALTGEELKYK